MQFKKLAHLSQPFENGQLIKKTVYLTGFLFQAL